MREKTNGANHESKIRVEDRRFMGWRLLEARMRAIRRRHEANVDGRLDLPFAVRAVAFDYYLHGDDSV